MMSRKPPEDDPNSIGRILMSFGVSSQQLSEALSLKKMNGELLLGEACVRLGFIHRSILATAIEKQAAARRGSASKMLKLATERTREMSASVSTLAAASIHLADKLK